MSIKGIPSTKRIDGEVTQEAIEDAIQRGGRTNIWSAEIPSFLCSISKSGVVTFSVKKKAVYPSPSTIEFGTYPEMSIESARIVAALIVSADRSAQIAIDMDACIDQAKRVGEKADELAREAESLQNELENLKKELKEVSSQRANALQQKNKTLYLIQDAEKSLDAIDRDKIILSQVAAASVESIVKAARPVWSRDATSKGVYFLVDGSELVYVGKSISIEHRIFTHMLDGRILFDKACFMPIDLAEDIDIVEQFFIASMQPRDNRYVPRSVPASFNEALMRCGIAA